MNKIRQILRGHFEGRGSKQLSQLTGVARNTVKGYLRRFKETGLTYQDAEQLSDEGLSELILGPPAPQQQSKRQEILSALLPAISKELRRKGMTQHRQTPSGLPLQPVQGISERIPEPQEPDHAF